MSTLTETQVKTKEAKEPVTRTLIAHYDEYFDTRTFSTTLRKTSKPKSEKKVKESKKPVLVIRRQINEKGQYDGTKIDIVGTRLRDVLTEVNHDVYGFKLTGDKGTVDPNALFYCRPRLQRFLQDELLKEPRNEDMITDLATVVEYTDRHWSSVDSDLARYLPRQEITFELLWTLIQPNTYVYQRFRATEQDQLLYARGTHYARREDGSKCFQLSCEVIHDDGDIFGIAKITLEIDAFDGTKKIQDLKAYPLEYHADREHLREQAIKRGKQFVTFQNPVYKQVNGPAISVRVQERDDLYGRSAPEERRVLADGRVMIDARAFYKFHRDSIACNPWVREPVLRDNLTDDQYAICMPYALGFSFAIKEWGAFAVDRLSDIVWSDEPFALLVLGKKQKTLVRALVRQHAKRSTQFDDIVPGKGKGLIGLLSGPPGTGKTLTAEAVAETTRKPLYIVSAGELGTSPETVDGALSRVLSLAQTWNAVLLLDEAEVFLQERSPNNVERNALVSIFLRQLEYYQGIMILTTNMARTCDTAMESRIHFCVHYSELNQEARLAIWKTFVARSKVTLKEEDLVRLSELRLNGRQIKNAVSSAHSIALDENEPMAIDHIDTVLDVLSEWQKARVTEEEDERRTRGSTPFLAV
ncbi:P-loop containing nucleoside triphosphate hydrolase protein [Mycena pura]|uniref:P-loop containing nucleoside triphosphate hydrolase protein n=1 Tax=Mycena pura TaxID=153505 RepID=A0AAD6V6V6_9AGAR|nr:P-loop containing nucleoside triphosphate hydrolase protein [Mycena pura]